MRPFGSRRIGVWIRFAMSAIAVVPIVSAPTLSQTCEDDNPPHAAALLDRPQGYCERNEVPWTFDLYALASVAGDDAAPALRKIAAWPLDSLHGEESSITHHCPGDSRKHPEVEGLVDRK